MKLAHPLFEFPIEFEENKINLLIIENKSICYEFIRELVEYYSGGISHCVVSEENQKIGFSDVEVVTDLFIDDKCIEEFYREIVYRKYKVLIIESEMPNQRFTDEKYKIIDNDLCEIS